MLKRLAHTTPVVGVLLFVLLYFYAAALYSTATTGDPATHGYQHLHNYWCDLYVPITYTGQVNPGRPYAMAATFILAASLAFFFVSVTALFSEFPRLCAIVRYSGPLAAVIASVVFTPWHNQVITVGVPLGAVAIGGTCIGLARKRHYLLLTLGIVAIADCGFDYLLWKMGLLHDHQPMIQKSAFVLLLLWVVASSARVLRTRIAVSRSHPKKAEVDSVTAQL